MASHTFRTGTPASIASTALRPPSRRRRGRGPRSGRAWPRTDGPAGTRTPAGARPDANPRDRPAAEARTVPARVGRWTRPADRPRACCHASPADQNYRIADRRAPRPHREREDERRRHRRHQAEPADRRGAARRPRRPAPPPGPSAGRCRPAPWGAGRRPTDAVTRVEPAIRPQDQPSPSSRSPPRAARAPGGRPSRPAPRRPAAGRRPAATVAVRPGPVRERPTSGENRYMPATCTLMTSPITRSASSPPPAWPMCTGVITMTPTITAWDDDHGGQAEPAGRRRPHRAQAGRVAVRGGGAPVAAAQTPGQHQRIGPEQRPAGRAATTAKTTAETTKAPPSGGRPSAVPRSAPGAGQVRTEHRADRRRPDHQRQRPAAALGGGQVGRRVARLQAAGGRRTEQEEAEPAGAAARKRAAAATGDQRPRGR